MRSNGWSAAALFATTETGNHGFSGCFKRAGKVAVEVALSLLERKPVRKLKETCAGGCRRTCASSRTGPYVLAHSLKLHRSKQLPAPTAVRHDQTASFLRTPHVRSRCKPSTAAGRTLSNPRDLLCDTAALRCSGCLLSHRKCLQLFSSVRSSTVSSSGLPLALGIPSSRMRTLPLCPASRLALEVAVQVRSAPTRFQSAEQSAACASSEILQRAGPTSRCTGRNLLVRPRAWNCPYWHSSTVIHDLLPAATLGEYLNWSIVHPCVPRDAVSQGLQLVIRWTRSCPADDLALLPSWALNTVRTGRSH